MKAIGFDADGVLVDSVSAARRAAERVLGAFGVTASIDSAESMEAAFGHAAQHALVGREHAADLRALHRLLMRHAAPSIGLFDDAISIVARLPAPRILITSALADGIKLCLGDHAALFADIVGFEAGRKTDLLAGLRSSLAVYVTDTGADIADCRNLGIRSIACAWGYDPRAILAAAKPNAIAETPDQLLKLIEAIT